MISSGIQKQRYRPEINDEALHLVKGEGGGRQRQTRSIGGAIKTPFLVYNELFCLVSAMIYTLAFRINFLRCYSINTCELRERQCCHFIH